MNLKPSESSERAIINAQEEEYWFPYHYVSSFSQDRFRHFFLDTWAINYVSTIEFLLAAARPEPGSRIIDIGCGDGRFSRELALANPSCEIVGVDYSKRAIALAAAMNQDVPNLRFEARDITAPHDLGTFDLAFLMEVFEHIPLPLAGEFARAVRGLVRPGGGFYLTVPHANKPVEYKHFQHFTIASLKPYFEPHFQILEIIPFERRSRLRSLLSRLLNGNWITVTNPRFLKRLYRWYKAKLFDCRSEQECQRLFLKAVAR